MCAFGCLSFFFFWGGFHFWIIFFKMNWWNSLLLCPCMLHKALDHFFSKDGLVDHFFALCLHVTLGHYVCFEQIGTQGSIYPLSLIGMEMMLEQNGLSLRFLVCMLNNPTNREPPFACA